MAIPQCITACPECGSTETATYRRVYFNSDSSWNYGDFNEMYDCLDCGHEFNLGDRPNHSDLFD
jgi:DNA-directed RNA polymerase subunit RPC12/RpoP